MHLKNIKTLSDDDLLFQKYLTQLRYDTLKTSLANSPAEHPRLLMMYNVELKELEEELVWLGAEISKRKLNERDCWTGDKVQDCKGE